jgi:hypothetical protein
MVMFTSASTLEMDVFLFKDRVCNLGLHSIDVCYVCHANITGD